MAGGRRIGSPQARAVAGHRRLPARRVPFGWLGAGAFTVGLGAAVLGGAGTAHADGSGTGSAHSHSGSAGPAHAGSKQHAAIRVPATGGSRRSAKAGSVRKVASSIRVAPKVGGPTAAAAIPAAAVGPQHILSGGELFLGGNFIELGLSSVGSFGSSTGKPAGFIGGTPPGPHPDSIGFVFDVDGFGSGADKALDFYVPDAPEERWSVGFNNTNYASFSALAGDSSNTSGLTDVSITDGSSGSALAGTFTATAGGVLKVAQVHTFKVNDNYYKTAVTLTNVSDATLQNVEFMRSFDPDGTRSVGGDNTTVNTVLGQIATDTFASVASASLEGDAYQVQTGHRAVTYFYSTDARATVYTGGFTNADPYDFDDANQATNYTTTADDAIGIIFKVGDLKPNASVTVSYYTGATIDDNPRVIEEDTGARPIKTIASTNPFIKNFNSFLQSDEYKNWMTLAGGIASVVGLKALGTAVNLVNSAVHIYEGDWFAFGMDGVQAAGEGLMAAGAKSKIGFLYAAGAAVTTIGYVAELAHETDWSDPGGTAHYAVTHPAETITEFAKATVQVGAHVGATVLGSLGGFLGIIRG